MRCGGEAGTRTVFSHFSLPALPEGAAAFAKTAVGANAFAAAPSVFVDPKATDAASLQLPAAGH